MSFVSYTCQRTYKCFFKRIAVVTFLRNPLHPPPTQLNSRKVSLVYDDDRVMGIMLKQNKKIRKEDTGLVCFQKMPKESFTSMLLNVGRAAHALCSWCSIRAAEPTDLWAGLLMSILRIRKNLCFVVCLGTKIDFTQSICWEMAVKAIQQMMLKLMPP